MPNACVVDSPPIEQVLVQFRPMIEWIIRRMHISSRVFTLDDLRQEANIAIVIALPRYDPGRGPLGAFLYARVHGAVVDFMRRAGDGTRTANEYRWKMFSSDGEFQLAHYIDPDSSVAYDTMLGALSVEQDAPAIRAAVAALPPLWRQAIELYYFQGWPLARVAALVNLTESGAYYRVRHGLDALRVSLGELGLGA